MAKSPATPEAGNALHLLWRADLSFGVASDEAKTEYRTFTRELETIPANERVRRVLDEQLWGRRRKWR